MLKGVLKFLLLSFFVAPIFIVQAQPAQKREFRGVWVATVANIDWPSKPGINAEIQKRELLRIFDEHQRSGMNAIVLQVRPTADAFYAKSSEPWSKWLTGKQGIGPYPAYDPLEFAVIEAHKRGMELHAWFNPYRAIWSLSDKEISLQHITRQHPEWFFNYGGQKLFNPGLPEVRSYIVQVIMNVVRNYDIDAIHFDDYFYPYQVTGRSIPDTEAYIMYGSRFKNIMEWRRSNVDTLIKTLSDSIHTTKRYLKFGIAPFGIWQNRSQSIEGSATNGGSSYVELYADTRKWLQLGWIDYVVPQLYWPLKHRLADFEILIDWWSNNTYGKHLYIGQAAYRAGENVQGFKNRSEIPNQIRHLRQNARVQGSVYFSSKSLTSNIAGLQDSLRNSFYCYPVLQPPMLWLDSIPPMAPRELTTLISTNSRVQLNWKEPLSARDGEATYGYVIYRFISGEQQNLQDGSKILKIIFDNKTFSYIDYSVQRGAKYTYVVTALDRLKNESIPSNQIAVIVN